MFLLVLAALLVASSGARAQEGVLSPFLPKPPTAGKHDWIRLTSGEWLKGELRVLRRDVIEFDSNELDDLRLDWEDIHEVRSPGPTTFVFEGREVLVGSAAIDQEHVVIRVAVKEGEEPHDEIRERRDLLAIIRGPYSERKRWRGKASVGASVRSGNTNQAEFYGTANVIREDSFTRATLDYTGAIGSTDNVRNVDNHRANLAFDMYVSRHLYITPAALEIRSDQFQNIALRFIPSAGVGYDLVARPKFDWTVELRPGYRWTRSVGDGSAKSDGIITANTTFEWNITRRLDMEGLYQVQVGIPDAGATDQHAQLMLSMEITRNVDLDVTFDWDRVGQPIEEDGVTPKQDDLRLAFSFGLDF